MSADDETGDSKEGLSKKTIDRMKKEFMHGVDYGRPPKEHQFKKGQSGNPRERPRGMAPDMSLADELVLQAVHNALNKTVRVREGDTFTEVTALEAVVQATVAASYKGNVRAAGLLFDLKRTHDQAHARDIKKNIDFWTRYKEVYSGQLAEASREGKPILKIVPHPDDIEIDDYGVRFLGPRDDNEQKRMGETIRFRDVLVMQDALDERVQTRLDGQPLKKPGGAILVAMMLQRAVPPRLRLSIDQLAVKQMRYFSMPKRRLLKELYSAWRELGRQVPRGYVFPDQNVVAKNLEFIVDFTNAASSGEIDVEAILKGVYDDNLLDFLERHGRPIEPYLQAATQ